mgnify:CR=1 FL=1
MSFFSFLKPSKASAEAVPVLHTDVHSHLIPGIDDGIQSIEEGLDILKELYALGYRKVITTPHTMPGNYDNTPEIILNGLESMRSALKEAEIDIKLEAATEYFLDETFMEKLEKKEPLMTLGKKYVLVETGFINESPLLKDATFHMTMQGYQMVYAHPERYLYLLDRPELIDELLDRDVLFQINAVSLTGCYSKPVQKLAEKLIDRGVVKLVGTDCHNMGHIELMKQARKTRYWNKLMKLPLLNNQL